MPLNLVSGARMQADPLAKLDVRHHVIVPPDVETAVLWTALRPLEGYLAVVRDRLMAEGEVLTTGAIASYVKGIDLLVGRLERLRTGQVKADVVAVEPARLREIEETLAENLSRALTHLAFVIENTSRLPVIQESKKGDRVAPWVGDVRKLVSAAVGVATDLAAYRRVSHRQDRDDVIDGLAEVLGEATDSE